MTTLSEAVDRVLTMQTSAKEEIVKHAYESKEQPDDDDLTVLSFVEFWRGDEVVAVAAIPSDRDTMLEIAVNGSYSFSADMTVVSFEGWAATTKINPASGEPWEPGDMAHLAQHERGRERGFIAESLLVTGVDREGNLCGRGKNFTIKDKEVIWTDDISANFNPGDEVVPTGLVNDALKFAMSKPSIAQIVSGEASLDPNETPEQMAERKKTFERAAAHLSREVMDFYMDKSGLKHLALAVGAGEGLLMLGLSAEPDSLRAQLIEEGMHEEWDGVEGVTIRTSNDLKEPGGS
jgi:hypothetical protein